MPLPATRSRKNPPISLKRTSEPDHLSAYALTIDMGGKHVPPVFSTMNMAGNIGAAVFPLLVPPLVAATDDWNAILFLFAGIYLAAGLIWLLFDSNGTIFDRPRAGGG